MQTFTVPLSSALIILTSGSVELSDVDSGNHSPSSKYGVTFTLSRAIDSDQSHTELRSDRIARLDIHAIKFNSAVHTLVELCKANSIRCYFYDTYEHWVARDRRTALSPTKVQQLTIPHTERWWHNKYSRLLSGWVELLYHHPSDQLSNHTRRILTGMRRARNSEDTLLVFDMMLNNQPPSVSDYRVTLLINRQLVNHSIDTYDQFVKFVYHKWNVM